MGRILSLKEANNLPDGSQLKEWAYNTLDVTGTREIADVLLPRMSPAIERTYAFERALQAPAMAMMLRGVRIDQNVRGKMLIEMKREFDKLQKQFTKMAGVVDVWDGYELETGFCTANFGKRHKWPRGIPDGPDKKCAACGISRVKKAPFSPTSTKQKNRLFYELHKIKPMYNKKGILSTDGDILERIGAQYPKLAHITEALLDIADKQKQIGSLSARLTADGRYPSSFNVGAAWTGRFSSSKNPYGLGGNLQNWAERHRAAAIADYGWELTYTDLKQAESNVVAHIADDQQYIDAHASGDVHTFVTRLVWPDLPWTGDLKKDKAIAKQNPKWDQAPGHDYRFQAKRIQHGSNYGLSPYGIAMIAHIPKAEAEAAQRNYFLAFPGIPAWQQSIAKKINNHEKLVNPLGREITLTGRPWDKHTYKQGLAFIPQSAVADILDMAMWRIWDELDPWELQLLAQVHDAVLGQFLKGRRDVLARAVELMKIEVPILGRTLVIQPEVAVGQNWGHKKPENPAGIDEVFV